MSDHDNSNPRNPLYAIVRNISCLLDGVAFGLLDLVYRLFFRVTTLDIFSNDTVMGFYSRVQLIIGVFMMFQLAMVILKGIMNPDSFMDSKTGGFNLITRIFLALIMFAFIIPINISSPKNEYERQINNNGLLFGTLYSLQYRLLKNNTIGRLVLDTDATSSTNADDDGRLTSSARTFTSTVVKTFYRINIKEDATDNGDGTTLDANEANWMCKSSDWHADEYKKEDVNPEKVIEMGMADTCNTSDGHRYALAYSGFISFITGFFFVFIFLSFTIDVAIRAIKLAILRLIAPIPIISYMDPKGSKDGAFNAWVKTLTSTYLDLFIRLAVIHFVLFIIENMIKGGIVMSDGRLRGISTIIIFAGLLIFAKDSPKFFRQALGMKDEPFKLFGGFGEIGAAVTTGIGTVGAFRTSMRASRDADVHNGLNPTTGFNRAKHLVAGITGGALGLGAGIGAAAGAKDHKGRAAFDAIAKRNAAAASAGRNGGTFFGAVGSDIGEMFSGQSEFARLELDWKRREQEIKGRELELKTQQDELKRRKGINSHRTNIMNEVKSKTVDNTDTRGSFGSITDANYYYFHSAVEAAKTRGVGVTTDASGVQWFEYNGQRIRYDQIDVYDNEIKKENEADFYRQVLAGTIRNDTITDEVNMYQAESGRVIEAEYGGATGLKAQMGAENRAISREDVALMQTSQELSEEREAINREKVSPNAERAESNAKRFRGGGK